MTEGMASLVGHLIYGAISAASMSGCEALRLPSRLLKNLSNRTVL